MSDTPETEASIWSDSCEGILCKVVSAEFARRLERERDEAREDAQKSKAYKRVLKVTNENLKRERDEAREEVRLLKAILDLIKKDVS